MKRPALLGTLIATCLLAIVAKGQQPAKFPPTGPNFGPVQTAEKIADNLYLIRGAGGDSAVLIRHDGVLLVDTKLPNNGQPLLDEIKKLTDKPITHIINTHPHVDHTGGNAFFAGAFPGVQIIVQENAKASMEKDPAFQSDAGKAGLPTRTYKDHLRCFPVRRRSICITSGPRTRMVIRSCASARRMYCMRATSSPPKCHP